jgi:uncharacterized membrane protein YfcA
MAIEVSPFETSTDRQRFEMSIDYRIILAGFIVGCLVGMTGAGGGALMTPILVLLFGVTPSSAISSDIVSSAVMKPFGGALHYRRGTVHLGLVLWLSAGSIPAAFAGVFIDHALGHKHAMEQRLQYAIGITLALAAVALVARLLLDSARRQQEAPGAPDGEPPVPVRRVLTVAIGVLGGLLVGITSIGAGSLMIVLLMTAYPRLSMRRLVGTDIVQSIPLVGSAAIGHALFGSLQFGVTTSITIGSIPGVLLGATLSTRAPNAALRPILAVVLLASALKLEGLSTGALAVTIAVIVAAGLPLWAFIDGFAQPEAAWRSAGYPRRTLLGLVSLGIPAGAGLVTAIIYFGRLRPQLMRAGAQEPRAAHEAALDQASAGTRAV